MEFVGQANSGSAFQWSMGSWIQQSTSSENTQFTQDSCMSTNNNQAFQQQALSQYTKFAFFNAVVAARRRLLVQFQCFGIDVWGG